MICIRGMLWYILRTYSQSQRAQISLVSCFQRWRYPRCSQLQHTSAFENIAALARVICRICDIGNEGDNKHLLLRLNGWGLYSFEKHCFSWLLWYSLRESVPGLFTHCWWNCEMDSQRPTRRSTYIFCRHSGWLHGVWPRIACKTKSPLETQNVMRRVPEILKGNDKPRLATKAFPGHALNGCDLPLAPVFFLVSNPTGCVHPR